ncbi:MAG: c-type cytochrome [Streptosporangiaceae bacterium]|nr:c-type cytochrome [Streptosporangiaceae bacterium]
MSWIIARRRRPAAGYAALLLGLALVAALYAAITGHGGASAAPNQSQQGIAEGEQLFRANCSTCHGQQAQGQPGIAPSLIGAGAASVDFQMSTGRMPLSGGPEAEAPKKPVRFTEQQIEAIADYIASLGGGPAIPSEQQVNSSGADPGVGSQLFNANCGQCHNAGLSGGALTYGKYAPALNEASPTQIYEAMLTGPEAMPVFSDGTLSPQAKRDIIAFITQTRSEPNPGGFSLGRTGPVTEGLVIWLGGMVFLVLIAMWITAKRRDSAATDTSQTGDTTAEIHEPGD